MELPAVNFLSPLWGLLARAVLPPTTCVVGCILSPLRGWSLGSLHLHSRKFNTSQAALGRTAEGGCPHIQAPATQAISMGSSARRLSFSSVPVSSKEFVMAALPFSTLVMT